MFGGGGWPGEEPRKPVDTEEYYNTLGVDKAASDRDIKKAYRKLAMKHHPDRGGDADQFKEIQKAYETLSDPKLRETYDKYGTEDPPHEGINIFDLFNGGPGRGCGHGSPRGDDTIYRLQVGLEQLYNGEVKKLKLTRNTVCTKCRGTGSKSGRSTTCDTCRGRGIRIITHQMGPVIQRMQTMCEACGGEGNCIVASDKCKKCRGNKVIQTPKILEVYIDKGMKNGQRIKFPGEADEAPGMEPGDVVVELRQKEHEFFKRQGTNLVMEKTISLAQALCGTTFTFRHLDGRLLKVTQGGKGEVISPGDLKIIENEGMPTHRNPYLKGALFVKFNVDFPKNGSLSKADKKKLKAVLDKHASTDEEKHQHSDTAEKDPVEEIVMTEITDEIKERLQERERDAQKEAYEEDDDRPNECPIS